MAACQHCSLRMPACAEPGRSATARPVAARPNHAQTQASRWWPSTVLCHNTNRFRQTGLPGKHSADVQTREPATRTRAHIHLGHPRDKALGRLHGLRRPAQRGLRVHHPVVLVELALSNPPGCILSLRTVIVAPMTTLSRSAGFRIPVTFQGKSGLILLDQIRALDKARLVKRAGSLHGLTQEKVLRTLQVVFEPAPTK